MKTTREFVEKAIDAQGPHAVLGAMITKMNVQEAHLLLITASQHYPSTVAQSILRDVLNRHRQSQLEVTAETTASASRSA